jgi:crotonobetainyl-CoA:carnitine CoA-transferase CaiB-like acyl-CoA transferase
MMDALAGSVHVVIGDDGLVRWEPQRSAGNSVDFGGEGTAAGAVYAAMTVLAAHVQRLRTGEGAYIDVAAADAVVAHAYIGVNWALNGHRVTDDRTVPTASTRRTADSDDAKYQYYATKDDKVVLFCAIEPKFWAHFVDAVGSADLEPWRDGKAADGPVDFADDPVLRRVLAGIFRDRTADEWVALALEADVPIGPVTLEATDLREEPHYKARGMFVDDVHPHAGPFTYIALPALVRGQPYEVRHHAPLVGEQTDEILAELGYDDAEVAGLHDRAVV